MTQPTPLPREVMAGFGKELLQAFGYEVTTKDLWFPDQPVEPPPAVEGAAGAFTSSADLERARRRRTEPGFDLTYQAHRARAQGLLGSTADPFHSEDFEGMVFGWSGTPPPNSLRVAVSKLLDQSDGMRRLALEFALSGDAEFARKAVELMLAWAERHTPVDLLDPGFDVDYPNANILGKTPGGISSDRPWNMALDTMWQAYGLVNASDAYLLVKRNGYAIETNDEPKIRGWLLRLARAVNSSFHAWTKWADPRPTSPSYERYRSDNHLSWCLAGLVAAAAALEDHSLANYVLRGSVWDDYGDGYANPSHLGDVVDRAIESGTAPEHEGRVYEEKIGRDPPIGYAIFHLTAMSLVAQVAEVHYGEDVWSWTGADGAGIPLALDRYAGHLLGTKTSPKPGEGYKNYHRLPWELAQRADVVDPSNRRWHYQQAIGPVPFLLGKDA